MAHSQNLAADVPVNPAEERVSIMLRATTEELAALRSLESLPAWRTFRGLIERNQRNLLERTMGVERDRPYLRGAWAMAARLLNTFDGARNAPESTEEL